jgi:TRAP-type C4-dicarboxylate transport system permease small subunit
MTEQISPSASTSMVARIGRGCAAVIHALSKTVAVISILGMIFLMFLIVWNVTLRFTGHTEMAGVTEYAELAMAVTAFFALGEAERRRQHVSMVSFLVRLRGRTFQVVRMIGGIGGAFVAVLLALASWHVLSDSIATGEYKLGLVRLPMWPARTAVFIGFLVLALEQIVTAVEDILNDVPVSAGGEVQELEDLKGN